MNLRSDQGNIMILAIVIAALMLATGLAYFALGSYESAEAAYEHATKQAYLNAETGITERGFQYIRSLEPNALPTATTFMDDGRGRKHFDNHISRVTENAEGNVFQRTDTYDIFSTGVGVTPNGVEVERTKRLRVRLRSFSNYMYLTDQEVTQFNERIWFWGPDTLYGRVHSNDVIAIKGGPVFFGPVSSSASDFERGAGYNPTFEIEPNFNVPKVNFPVTAETIRAGAQPFVNGVGKMTRIWMRGATGIMIYQYDLGTSPPDDMYNPGNVEVIGEMAPPAFGGVFINGQCEVYGELTGKLTIGSSGDMYLIDDVRYTGATRSRGYFGYTYEEQKGNNNMLGLISERNIIIKDNYPNGKANGRRHIVINAAMVALGQSFTFEHQNDDFELYQGPEPDERGYIYLTGAVTQKRRGYVHRSNHGGTGYGKSYHYDFRLDHTPPPFYLEALDEDGHGLFDKIEWEEMNAQK